MKKFKCYDCDKEFFSGTRDDVLEQLYSHYMKEHKAVITGASPSEKEAWMSKFEKDWTEAEEV